MLTVSVADVKNNLSKFMAKCSYGNERFVITCGGKPVAALVGLEDLQVIEQNEERQGLASLAGKWKSFGEVADYITPRYTAPECSE